jgi:hypothetical protein
LKTVVVGTRQVCLLPEFAGNTWAHMQWVLGLQRLGFDVVWVDHLEPLEPLRQHHSVEHLVREFRRTAAEFGFEGRWAIALERDGRVFGMTEGELQRAMRDADLLINLSKVLGTASPLLRIPRRAYVDMDPGFTQIWVDTKDLDLRGFQSFFTVGQNVCQPDFPVPAHGIRWQAILPPVVLDQWPARIDAGTARFSTVGDWRGSQQVLFRGNYYAGKRGEFVQQLELPVRTRQRFELALCLGAGDHEDLGLLHAHGWIVLDPFLWAGNPFSYREFIQTSRAEFSVAKSGYVRLRTGWISDRTACYLASGKPAVVQSTGFEESLATGKGLLTFRTVEEAAAAVAAVESDYLGHCRAARAFAEAHLASDRVLGKVLGAAGL